MIDVGQVLAAALGAGVGFGLALLGQWYAADRMQGAWRSHNVRLIRLEDRVARLEESRRP